MCIRDSKIEQSIKGYNAIESLIRKCSKYGDVIANQMTNWGVDFSSSKDTELNILDVDTYSDDEANETITNDSANVQIIKSSTTSRENSLGPSKRKRNDDEEEFSDVDYEESDDDDFDVKPRARTKQKKTSITQLRNNQMKFIRQKPKLLRCV